MPHVKIEMLVILTHNSCGSMLFTIYGAGQLLAAGSWLAPGPLGPPAAFVVCRFVSISSRRVVALAESARVVVVVC
jgi:hypothetical protein